VVRLVTAVAGDVERCVLDWWVYRGLGETSGALY
jgi:hypothetical protein